MRKVDRWPRVAGNCSLYLGRGMTRRLARGRGGAEELRTSKLSSPKNCSRPRARIRTCSKGRQAAGVLQSDHKDRAQRGLEQCKRRCARSLPESHNTSGSAVGAYACGLRQITVDATVCGTYSDWLAPVGRQNPVRANIPARGQKPGREGSQNLSKEFPKTLCDMDSSALRIDEHADVDRKATDGFRRKVLPKIFSGPDGDTNSLCK